MTIYDLRKPCVENPSVLIAIGLAYTSANRQDRHKYIQVLDNVMESSSGIDSSSSYHLDSVRETCNKRVGGILKSEYPLNHALIGDNTSFTRSPEQMPMHISFPPHDQLKSCGWKQFGALRAAQPDILYLNPMLLDKFERACRRSEKVSLLVIMHCIVCHELAHLLHYKMYNTIDSYFCKSAETTSEGHREYGTEVEHCLFGGRMLSTPDLSGLRIERKNGEVFGIDFNYFYEEFLRSDRGKIDFGTLVKVNLEEDSGQSWIGMGEINGTHHI